MSLKSKAIFFVLFFSFFQENSFAQTCKRLQEKAGNLFQQGKIQDAIKIAQIGVEICRKETGDEHPDYVISLNNLAWLYIQVDNYKMAESLYLKVLAIQKKIHGESHMAYANTLYNLAELYCKMNNYSKAELLYLQELSICKKIKGEDHIEYAKSMNNLSLLYTKRGNYNKAEALLIQSLVKCNKLLGEENSDCGFALNNLAGLYRLMGKYVKSESLFLQTISIRKKLGEYDPNYANSLEGLAGLYSEMGNFKKADSLYTLITSIYKKVFGEDDPKYAASLGNHAVLYYEMGNYNQAELLNISALEIINNIHGKDHPDYSNLLGNLAALNSKKGNYSKAESLYVEALSIEKRVLGEDHPDYAKLLNNFAEFYTELNNYSKAELLYNQALIILKKVIGEEHPDYAPLLNNIARIYMKMGNYSKAEPLLLQAETINIKSFRELHPSHSSIAHNLADLYKKKGNYNKAEYYYNHSLSINKKILGEDHIDYATTLNNLAFLYIFFGNKAKAEKMLMQALEIYKQKLSSNHPNYMVILNNIAGYHDLFGDYPIADSLIIKIVPILKRNWQINFSFLSTNESDFFLNSNLYFIDLHQSFLSRYKGANCIRSLYDLNLFIKNHFLSNYNHLQCTALNKNDTSIAYRWKLYKLQRLQISKQYQLPLSEQNNLKELEEQAETLEKDLMRSLPEFHNAVQNNNLTWKDVQAKLKPSEAAIDFVSFRYYDKRWTDTTMYAAFLIRPEWTEPKFVNLFREEQLASLFESTNNSISINNLYNNNPALYNLIWQPMDSLLTGVNRVYVSPSGLLHRISLSAVPVPEGGNLNDRYDIHIMGNVRALAEKQTKTDKTPTSSLLYGGIDYDNEPTVTMTAAPSYEVVTDSTLRSLRGGKWSFLKGTSDEVSRIQTISSNSGLSTKVFSKATASEEAFKLLGQDNSPIPLILHIATHGFAFSTPENRPKNDDRMMMISMQEDRRYVFRETTDPLTRAGLVMAGGNKVWSTGQTYPNKEDGILTAREISNMDLRGCMLATLSACETGLGEIKGSEGVFGLQRAFKMAGVQHLIVSLWKVPDRETSEFMETFYTNWLTNKLPLREAFRQTQQVMSKKYKPYQWAAFVLVE